MGRLGFLIVMLSILVAAGCSDRTNVEGPMPPPPSPPSIPSLTVDQLLAAPESLQIHGMTLSVSVGLSRDFMPSLPPEGTGLRAYALINGSPPGSFPDSMSDVYVWAIRDSAVWDTTMVFALDNVDGKGTRQYWADGGPRWDTGALVDVVIGVRTSRTEVSLVRFRDVLIQRVE
jgi:hypothetical protein